MEEKLGVSRTTNCSSLNKRMRLSQL